MITLILESADYSPKALAVYKGLGDVFYFPNLSDKKKKDILEKAEILVVRLAHHIDSSWLSRMPCLKIIATPTTGLNHIDRDAAKKRGIKVISLKGYTSFLKNIPSTAEETVALMLALIRHIPWAFDHVKGGGWNRNLWRGHQLIHKTLGLIGCGRLGKIVARYARAFGMRVIGFDPYVNAHIMKRFGIEKMTLEKLLKQSDIVSIHVALEKNTNNLIREKHFKRMKPTAYLVNTSRGEIIDECALVKALKKKWIAGAALDVLRNESGDGKHLKNNPLIDYARKNSNLLIVPHIGGATYEAMQVTEDFIAAQVLKAIKK